MTLRALIASLFLLPSLAHALEVPLSRGQEKGKKSFVLGFVDMDRIYQEFPETQKAKKEYQAQADRIKGMLADQEAELADLRDQLSILRAAQQAPAVPSTATAVGVSTGIPAPPADLSDKERQLQEQEADLTASKKEAAQALAEYEKKRAAQIFGKLYKSLVQLADEKGVDLVLDKSGLLYGQEGLDLTEALSRRVRGLPDSDE